MPVGEASERRTVRSDLCRRNNTNTSEKPRRNRADSEPMSHQHKLRLPREWYMAVVAPYLSRYTIHVVARALYT